LSRKHTDTHTHIVTFISFKMISFETKFRVYLFFLIPSIFCSLFDLYHFLFNKTSRQSLHNHVIIVLLCIGLICQVTNYPWMLYYYQYGDTWERSWIFCTIWGFLDWPMYLIQTILFAWTTIERHILIFHDRLVSTKVKRLIFHYLPLSLLLLYCLTFYIILYFFPPCGENISFNFDMICIFPCYLTDYRFYMWETIGHQLLPIFTIVFFSITLFVRVVCQKRRMHRAIRWRKHRKMTLQLLSISLLYLVFSFPFVVVTILYLTGSMYSLYGVFLPYANFFSYLIILLFPFVCALSLPDLKTKLKRIFCLRVRQINPMLAGGAE